jgi:hypothetical protein
MSGAPSVSKTPAISFGAVPVSGETLILAAAGRDDDAPTPCLFQSLEQRAKHVVTKSPTTPDDVAFQPIAFTKSAGSHFATPEVPITTGMSPVTAIGANVRQAQRHVPAWNRVYRVVETRASIAYNQVKSLQTMPGTVDQPAWAKTPYMLLKGLCEIKGWKLTHRKETEGRIGEPVAVAMTVVIPSSPGSPTGGRTVTAVESTPGAPRPQVAWTCCGPAVLVHDQSSCRCGSCRLSRER